MRPRWRRAAGVACAVLVTATAPAHAGGSWLTADRYDVGPGDVVRIEGEAHPGQLGWVEDGPFVLSLRPVGEPYGFRRTPRDVPVGRILLHRTTGVALAVSATFTVPDLPAGRYDLVYCDRSCDGGLGDLIGLDRPFTIAAPPAPAAVPLAAPAALGSAAAALLVAVGAGWARRCQPASGATRRMSMPRWRSTT